MMEIIKCEDDIHISCFNSFSTKKISLICIAYAWGFMDVFNFQLRRIQIELNVSTNFVYLRRMFFYVSDLLPSVPLHCSVVIPILSVRCLHLTVFREPTFSIIQSITFSPCVASRPSSKIQNCIRNFMKSH